MKPKKIAYVFILMVFACVQFFSGRALAQVKIEISDIKKIKLVDFGSGLIGFRKTEFEIVKDSALWKCYQTHQEYSYRGFKDSALYRRLTTNNRIFVKSINERLISNLLKSLCSIKPVFKPQYINIKPDTLIAQLGSQYWKRLNPFEHQVYLKLLNNKKVINASVEALQEGDWTDDYPFCGIEIIKRNNDTVKIESRRQVDFMLPWVINGVKSYDVGINRFFIEAAGDYPISGKTRLSGKWFPITLANHITRFYKNDIIERHNLETKSPFNFALLQKKFKVLRVENWGKKTKAQLKSKAISANCVITSKFDITNDKQLKCLLAFANDTLKQFLKTDNFLVKAFRKNKASKMHFSFDVSGNINTTFWNYLLERYPYLHAYKLPVLEFEITRTDIGKLYLFEKEKYGDMWLLLPDGKMVLLAYFDDNVTGVSSDILKPTGIADRKEVFLVFNADGKLIYKDNGRRY